MSRGRLRYGIEIFVVVLVLGSLLGLQVIPANGPKTEIMDADGDTKIQVEESADEDIVRIDTAGVERVTIDASGDISFLAGDVFITNNGLVIGHTAQIIASNTSEFQVLGTSGADASQVFARFSANNKGPQFNLLKSRSGTIGINGIVLDNDVIGQFKFLADDGVDFSTQAALFYAEVDDASPALGDIGTALVWEQMPGAAGALRETMRLAANGTLKLSSTIGAFIPNLLTTTQRDALMGINGMLFYNSTLDRGQLREGGAWASLVTPGSTDTFTNKTFDTNATGNSLSNVDVADLANGTAGELITWDASGNPAKVPVGTSGQVFTSNGAGAAPTFQAAAGGTVQVVIVVDEKAAGTAGGGSTAGSWQTRDLNTLRVNDGTIASLSSNQVTLPAGTYECWISAPAYKIGGHMIRLQDMTAISTIVTGTSEKNDLATAVTRSFIYHKFTISVSSALEVQHRSVDTKANNGFGIQTNFGSVETYTIAIFRKVD